MLNKVFVKNTHVMRKRSAEAGEYEYADNARFYKYRRAIQEAGEQIESRRAARAGLAGTADSATEAFGNAVDTLPDSGWGLTTGTDTQQRIKFDNLNPNSASAIRDIGKEIAKNYERRQKMAIERGPVTKIIKNKVASDRQLQAEKRRYLKSANRPKIPPTATKAWQGSMIRSAVSKVATQQAEPTTGRWTEVVIKSGNNYLQSLSAGRNVISFLPITLGSKADSEYEGDEIKLKYILLRLWLINKSASDVPNWINLQLLQWTRERKSAGVALAGDPNLGYLDAQVQKDVTVVWQCKVWLAPKQGKVVDKFIGNNKLAPIELNNKTGVVTYDPLCGDVWLQINCSFGANIGGWIKTGFDTESVTTER